jgi:hypothetical protein
VAVVERVDAETRRIDIARVVLLPVAGVLWLLGFVAGRIWSAVLWAVAALEIGWTDARTKPRRR